ncbi:hypothetical protein H072_9990 [Dactylellina haptotyla CBS 200.50]|uniref:Extracellular membrane protein CFEM domain-containing protein n=1 Tax=Dactylellina haptotyla (strain CBS 200.50) TaxID=1284197 RepID=S8BMK2_DACHA|nr:hypothetical protein H072_9990 [Dactylellina haptotyla CBS 200.50]
MQFLAVVSLFIAGMSSVPFALAGPLPLPGPLPTPMVFPRLEPTSNSTNSTTEAPIATTTTAPEMICPFSATVTASRSCDPNATCADPMFCIQAIILSTAACECSDKPPTTTTVTPRCPSDCDCSIRTYWIEPTACAASATGSSVATLTTTSTATSTAEAEKDNEFDGGYY